MGCCGLEDAGDWRLQGFEGYSLALLLDPHFLYFLIGTIYSVNNRDPFAWCENLAGYDGLCQSGRSLTKREKTNLLGEV